MPDAEEIELLCTGQQLQMLEAHAMEDSTKYKDFTKNETIEEIEIVDASYHSTLCSNCRTVCHDHCSLQETTTQGTWHASAACKQCSANWSLNTTFKLSPVTATAYR